MLRHPLCKELPNRLNKRLLMMILSLLFPVLSLPAFALAAPDSVMQQSLQSFFDNGVVVHGATAQLIRVERWPETTGSLRWSLPVSLRAHPKRFSLIAEQGAKRWYVPVRVHWWATAIVMNKSVSARSLLTHDMLKKTRTDIAGHSGHWLQQKSELIGMRLMRRMHKGDLVMSSHVKRPPLIKRGDIVQIILDLGRLHVRAEGKAMRSASAGERLLVKNLRSQEIVQGRVERAGTVRVRLL